MRISRFLCLLIVLNCISCNPDGPIDAEPGLLQLVSLRIGTEDLTSASTTEDTPRDKPIVGSFTQALDTATVLSGLTLTSDVGDIPFQVSFLDQSTAFSLNPSSDLEHFTLYTLEVGKIRSADGKNEFPGLMVQFRTQQGTMELVSLTVTGEDLLISGRVTDISLSPDILAVFSEPLDPTTVTSQNIFFSSTTSTIPVSFDLDSESKSLTIAPEESLEGLSKHSLTFSIDLRGQDGFLFAGSGHSFYTSVDSTLKFPEVTDDELLTTVQQQTFRYFWDFGHPVSGLARERNTSGDLVTSGGSGFGLMAIIVGIERGFISRQDGIDRLTTIVDFLNTADRFHGVWSHWLNGITGEVIPFSANDDGGDLVETSFLAMGLLTVRQYLDTNTPEEQTLIDRINDLWTSIEWNWHVQEGQEVLTWHWSPNFGFEKNLAIRGWNESLITYVMAASSPTFPIEPVVYHNGWARNGGMQNGNMYYDIMLPLGSTRGGPLFFAHYSFLGLDPRNLSDQYADYWQQNVAHTLINRAYCHDNPGNWVGYGGGCWGLTASDNHQGYNAHSPTNDLGVITPTAAISSIPYTPQESLEAIRHFYYYLGDRLWDDFGFVDAFNPTEGWYASSHLAIDQGPIIIMIENHRSALLWELFMSAPEVQEGLTALGFSY